MTTETTPASPAARERTPVGRFVRPVQEFIATESAGGLVLVVAALLALLWVNSPWDGAYHDLLETRLIADVNLFRVDESLHFWVNDVAMVLFFFLVGLEIKREMVLGELRSARRVALPLAAALGGMVAPVAIFLLIAGTGDARAGWGIPMATDIAFALGVMALLGPRVPMQLKVLLLAVVIFDDLATVGVIAVFYTESIDFPPLLLGAGLVGVVWGLNRAGVRSVLIYLLVGVAMWAVVLESGVHPTIVGVTLGLLTPWRSWYSSASFTDAAERLLTRLRAGLASPSSEAGREQRTEALLTISSVSRETVAPLDRLEHGLHPWVAFAVVPAFAWANAGIALDAAAIGDAAGSRLTWAIALGLALGKPVGLTLGWAIAVRAGAEAAEGVGWQSVLGIGVLAGIGFTIALFVTDLAYDDVALVAEAKVGILAASVLSGVGGFLVLWRQFGRG